MSNVKKGGILYTKRKTPKFQGGATFAPQDFSYGDAALFGDQKGNTFGQQPATPLFGKDPNAFKKTVPGMTFSTPKIEKPSGYNFDASRNTKSPALNSMPLNGTPQLTLGYEAAEKAKNKQAPKPGMPSAGGIVSAAAPVIDMAGSALSNTTDGDDTTFTGKESAGKISGSALKGATTGLSVATTLASLAPATTAAVAGTIASTVGVTTAATTLGTAAAATGVAAGVGAAGATAVGVGGGAALAGAAAGSVVPIVGTAIGLAIGAIVGVFMSKKAKKKARKAGQERDVKMASIESAKNRSENSARDSMLAGAPAPTSAYGNAAEGVSGGYLSARNGGSFYFKLKESSSENRVKMIKPAPPKKLKRGGTIKATENIIPNGVLHEEFNKLGDKGMPVVKCKNNACEKKYEIEMDEMIFTLDTTKTVEKMIKEGDLKKLGRYVKTQVLDNTHSYTDKFNDLNNYKNNNESIYT